MTNPAPPDLWELIRNFGPILIAAAALVLSIVNFVQASERRILWKVEDLQRENGISRVRLINTSQRWAAFVVTIDHSNLMVNAQPALHEVPELPEEIEPGNWLPIAFFESAGERPVRIRILWRQRRLGREKTRTKLRSAELFL
jgi:hypothetical protein